VTEDALRFRDRLLASLGLLLVSEPEDVDELATSFADLDRDQRPAVLANLAVLSLMKPLPQMPDPTAARARIAGLVRRLEEVA
jgi:hypothetical protein